MSMSINVGCYDELTDYSGKCKFPETSGYKYLKTGDYSGDICIKCDSWMYVVKTGKRGQKWELHCHCGRVIPFVSNNDPLYESVYK
jgi:hypothetical protein